MGILDFLAAIIPPLGWPAVTLIAFLLFHRPLYRFLELLPTMEVHYKGFKLFLKDRHKPPPKEQLK